MTGTRLRSPPRVGLRLQLLIKSVWWWFLIGSPVRSVTCAERCQPPALRRTVRVSGFGFPYCRTVSTFSFGRASGLQASGPAGSGLVSDRSRGMSPVFRLGQARRHKSIDMDCWVCAWIPFLGIQLAGLLSGQFRQPPRPLGAQQGRLFALSTTVKPSLITRVREDGWEYLLTWTNGHGLGPSPGMALEKIQKSCH